MGAKRSHDEMEGSSPDEEKSDNQDSGEQEESIEDDNLSNYSINSQVITNRGGAHGFQFSRCRKPSGPTESSLGKISIQTNGKA